MPTPTQLPIKYCKALPASSSTTTPAQAARFMDKALYEFWGFCVNGGQSLTVPGGFAATNGVSFPSGFQSGSSTLLATGSDGSTTFGTDVFRSTTVDFVNGFSGSLIGKYLVTWTPGGSSTDDSVYLIKSVEDRSHIRVDVNSGGTRRRGNHAYFTDRSSIMFRIVDILQAARLAGWQDGHHLIMQFAGAPLVNPGQLAPQVRFVHHTQSSGPNTGQEGDFGVIVSPSGSWNGSVFSDATAEQMGTWFNAPVTGLSNGLSAYTFIGAKDFIIVEAESRLGISGSTQGASTLGAGLHVEVPQRLYPAATDPNPVAWMAWSASLPSQVASTYYNGFNMVGFDGAVRQWTTLVRSPMGTQVRSDYTGAAYGTGQWQQFGVPSFRFAFMGYNDYDDARVTSDGLLSLALGGQFSLARARLRRARFTTNDLVRGSRLGDPLNDTNSWSVVSNGVLWPWDNSILPFGAWQALSAGALSSSALPAVPIASLDFSALPMGAFTGSLPGGSTYACLSGTQRGTIGTDVSGNVVVTAAAIAPNVPLIGDGGLGLGRGLVIEPSATFKPITPATGMVWFDANGSHITSSAGQVAPDGTTTAVRWDWGVPAPTYTSGLSDFTTGIVPATGSINISLFVKHLNTTKINMYNPYNVNTLPVQDLAPQVWTRFDMTSSAVGGNSGHGIGGDTGVSPPPLLNAWSGHLIQGVSYPLEPTGATTIALTTSRLLTTPLATGATNLRTGPQNINVRLVMKGGSTEQSGPVYLISWDATTYVVFDNVTKLLTVSSGGSTVTFVARGVYFNRDDIEFWIRFGAGGPTRAGYHVIGGPKVDLGSGAVLPDVAASNAKLCRANDDGGVLGCWLKRIDVYAQSDIPPWMLGATVLGSFAPAKEQWNQLAVHGNSRVSAQPETFATIQQQLPGHLSNWTMINVGHSNAVTSGGAAGTNLQTFALSEIDPLINHNAFLRALLYFEAVNGILILGTTAAQEWAKIQSYYSDRAAAGWNAFIFVTLPMEDPARQPGFAAANPTLQAYNALVRAQYASFAASLGVTRTALIDVELDSFIDMTDPAKSYDGTHWTALTYSHLQQVDNAPINGLWTPALVS